MIIEVLTQHLQERLADAPPAKGSVINSAVQNDDLPGCRRRIVCAWAPYETPYTLSKSAYRIKNCILRGRHVHHGTWIRQWQ